MDSTQKLGRWAASKAVARASWNLLKQDKVLVAFPLLSTITHLIFLALLGLVVAIYFPHEIAHLHQSLPHNIYFYLLFFVFLLICALLSNFFAAGIFTVVHARFHGQQLGFWDGLGAAIKDFHKILVWSFIISFVGALLQALRDKLKVFGNLASSLLNISWQIVSYFAFPIYLFQKEGNAWDAIKASAEMIRKTWGETAILKLGVGLLFVPIFFSTILIAGLIIFLAQSTLVTIITSIIFGVLFVVEMMFYSTLSTIFTMAIYEYATQGSVPDGFPPELVKGAMAPKV